MRTWAPPADCHYRCGARPWRLPCPNRCRRPERSSDALHNWVYVLAFESHSHDSLGRDATMTRGQSPTRQETAGHVAPDAFAAAPEQGGSFADGKTFAP